MRSSASAMALDLSAVTLKTRSTVGGQTQAERRCPTLLKRWLDQEKAS